MKGWLDPVAVARVAVDRPGTTGHRRVASHTLDPALQVSGAVRAVGVPDGAVGVSNRAVDVEHR